MLELSPCSWQNNLYWFLGLPDVILAGWEEEMYEVKESDLSLSICAIQMANIERDVPVTFSTLPQSAISEYKLHSR